MTDEMLTAHLSRALTAAAEQVHVSTPLDPSGPDIAARGMLPRRRTAAARWLMPAAAAAVVVLLLVTGMFAWRQQQKVSAAARVTVSGDVADLGGVRFTVPSGWRVAVTRSDSVAVHVCVAAEPASTCDGVELDIAVPDWFNQTRILPAAAPIFDSCAGGTSITHTIMTDDHNPIAVAGRPGIHYWGYCGNASAISHLWQLDDLSLQIYSPPGRYAAQISTIVAGLDLTQWAHHQGPQAAFFTSASSARPTS